MSEARERDILWIFWPFVAIWRLLGWIIEFVGRIICALLGFALAAVGVALSLSIVGAPLGVPLAAIGLLFMIRALF